MPQFDAYLTWQGYDGWEYRKETRAAANLIWNGVELGRGEAAAQEAIRRLALLPIGSRVLVFPRYEECGPQDSRMYPEPIYSSAFLRIVTNNSLTIIWSPFDNNGRLVPGAFDGEHFPVRPEPEDKVK